jgi:hypothetical protein
MVNGVVVGDGDASCKLNGRTWSHPISVWRGATFQAENATQLGGQIIFNPANGGGRRVGYLGATQGVQFNNVSVAAAGAANLVVYYTNGDGYNVRYLQFVVNGGPPQVKAFGGTDDWNRTMGATITLNGFGPGSMNSIRITGDGVHNPPDLDWIEVLGSSSTLPPTGICKPSMWNVTASASGTAGALDGDLATRWTTGRPMTPGDYYQIDFTGTVNLSAITLNNTQTSPNDFAATYALYTSQDGVTFSPTPALMAPGAAGQTNLMFPQESLRAVRIQVTSVNGTAWWSIGEVQTNCALTETLVRYPQCVGTQWATTASVNPQWAGAAADGTSYSKWPSGRYQDGTDWYQVDFRANLLMSQFVLDQGIWPTDYPGAYEAYASTDGVTFEPTPFASGVGSSPQTVINFTPRRMRALKIKQVGTANAAHYWMLAELKATCSI